MVDTKSGGGLTGTSPGPRVSVRAMRRVRALGNIEDDGKVGRRVNWGMGEEVMSARDDERM